MKPKISYFKRLTKLRSLRKNRGDTNDQTQNEKLGRGIISDPIEIDTSIKE